MVLEEQGGEHFFGEPARDIHDLMRTDLRRPRLDERPRRADKPMNSPQLYATFLLWLMSELFEELPEVGDLDKPKLVFFFDEAHLLFTDAPGAAAEDRAGGAADPLQGRRRYFVTQNPLDVPDTVLAQLGTRVEHAPRAFMPREQKAVKAVADHLPCRTRLRHRAGDHPARRRRGRFRSLR